MNICRSHVKEKCHLFIGTLWNEPLDCWSIANGENSRKYVLDVLYYASRWTEKDIPRDSYICRLVPKF